MGDDEESSLPSDVDWALVAALEHETWPYYDQDWFGHDEQCPICHPVTIWLPAVGSFTPPFAWRFRHKLGTFLVCSGGLAFVLHLGVTGTVDVVENTEPVHWPWGWWLALAVEALVFLIGSFILPDRPNHPT